MPPTYMPFTYIPESTARLLFALVGPVVIYQPLATNIPASLATLASQGLIEIRTPTTRDDDRLRAALVEFTDWARLNPGKTSAGAGFFGARQGDIPFFDETGISRIRSDIKRYHLNQPAGQQVDATEAGFSARLFLALAQENDQATDSLDHDLNRFNLLEKDFLETLKDADEVGFDRQVFGGTIWQDDPGAKLTGQRIRAWATLADVAADVPEMLITTSRAVIDTLMETWGDALGLKKLSEIRLPLPPVSPEPVLGRVLAELVGQVFLPSVDLAPLAALAGGPAPEPGVTLTLFVVAHRTPATVIRLMTPATVTLPDENETPQSVVHTLIVLVED